MLSCTATAVLGTAAAFLVERVRVAGCRFWAPLLVAPLAIPAFVTSYGWVSIFPGDRRSVRRDADHDAGLFPVRLPAGGGGAARPRSGLGGAGPRRWGCARAQVLRRVVLPQLRPAILGGALLVGLHCLAEFGAFGMLRFATFTTAIYDQYSSSFASTGGEHAGRWCWWPAACSWWPRSRRVPGGPGSRGSGAGVGPRSDRAAALGGAQVPALLFLAVLVAAALGVPMSSVAYWLGRRQRRVAAGAARRR